MRSEICSSIVDLGHCGVQEADSEWGEGQIAYECPQTGHLVSLSSLPDCLLVLGIFALEGIGHEVLVDEDLGVESVFLLEGLDVDILALRLDAGGRHCCLYALFLYALFRMSEKVWV